MTGGADTAVPAATGAPDEVKEAGYWTCHRPGCGVVNHPKRQRYKCKAWRMGKRQMTKNSRNKFRKKQKLNAAAVGPTGDSACASPDKRAGPPGEVNIMPSGLATNNMSPCTGLGGESITDVSLDVTEDTAYSLAMNAELSKIREAEMRNHGNGGDSDVEGEGYDHMRCFTDARIEAEGNNEDVDVDRGLEEAEDNFLSNVVVPELQESLMYAPPGWKQPGPDEKWRGPPARKVEKGEPAWEDVDNPGKWSQYTYRPKFKADGTYDHHEMPSGATPVPKNSTTGKRTINDWEVFYDGWEHPDPNDSNTRGGTRNDLFPSDRDVLLDAELLRKLGMSRTRLTTKDALFFFQLLCPIASPRDNGIDDDPRMPYYEKIAEWTDRYAVLFRGRGGSQGHTWFTTYAQENVRWDGIIMRNKNKAVTDNWDETKDGSFDRVIADSMNVSRFLDLKLNQKLICPVQEKELPDRGDPGYDPSRKFRYIWDAPIFNMNCLIKRGGKDVVIDETTWPNESPADMQGRLRGKKCNKGGQSVLVVDARRRYIYAHTPRHSFFEKVPPFTQQGPAEVKRLFDSMSKLMIGSPKPDDDKRRQIWDELPHTSMDNHFSGNNVIKYIGELGGRGLWTTARGRLPEGIPKKYLQCKKEVLIGPRSKAARYENPVVAVKHVQFPAGDEKKPYSVVRVSFQSTGSTNITCVNALRELKLFVRKRERGRGASKRVWAIEMNEARELYLKTYSGVDKIDQLLKEWGCKIRTFRW